MKVPEDSMVAFRASSACNLKLHPALESIQLMHGRPSPRLRQGMRCMPGGGLGFLKSVSLSLHR